MKRITEINIPLSYNNISPEDMHTLWKNISNRLSHIFGFYSSVKTLKKITKEQYPVYYTKTIFHLDTSLFVPDIKAFILAKNIQENFGLRSLTLKIQPEENNEELLIRLQRIFNFMTNFCSQYKYQNSFFGLNKRIHFFDYIDFPYSHAYSNDLYKGICYFKRKTNNDYNLAIGINMDSDIQDLAKFYSHEQAHAFDYILGEHNTPFSSLPIKKIHNKPYLFNVFKNILSLAYNNSLPLSDNEVAQQTLLLKQSFVEKILQLKTSKRNTELMYTSIEKNILKSKVIIPESYKDIILFILAKDDTFGNFYPQHKPFLVDQYGDLHPHFFEPEFLNYVMLNEERFANSRYVNSHNLLLHSFFKELFVYIEEQQL